ncbi:MAG: type IV secretory system conjugative DNA transfer family protein [Lachnospiraceae bacterium]|nr:type IV secretory system conjugative DNA transfer family protein [Lachnospiraceae bacterium]
MVKKLWKWILYYKLILLAVLGILFFLGESYLSKNIEGKLPGIPIIITGTRYMLYFIFGSFYAYIVFATLRNRRYHQLTGRNYSVDSAKYYPRKYYDLVEVFHPALSQKIQIDNLPVMKWYESGGIILGKVGKHLISFEPRKDGIVIFVWGTPGTGKSTSIILPTLICFGKSSNGTYQGSVMALDLKGELYEKVIGYGAKRNIKLFSLMDPSKSVHFDPLISIRKASDDEREELLGNLSIILIPDEASKDAAYFISVARAFLMGIFLFTLHIDPEASFSEICQDITKHDFKNWGARIEDSGYNTASKYTNQFKNENETNVGGGYNKLCESVRLYTSGSLASLLSNSGEVITPADLDNGKTDIYIQVDATKLDYYSRVIGMLFEVFMRETLERRTRLENDTNGKANYKPLVFVLDEFGQMPYIPGVPQMAALGRGFNVSVLIATQSLAMIDLHYGIEGRKALMDCAKAHAFLSVKDTDVQKWASDLIGTHKVLTLSTNQNDSSSQSSDSSKGFSYSDHEEPFFKPNDFAKIVEEDKVIIYYDSRHIKADKTYYFK